MAQKRKADSLSKHDSNTEEGNEAIDIAAFLKSKTTNKPKVGIICGSGLGGLAGCIEGPEVFKYEDIPGFPCTTVQGHAGELVFGKLGDTEVVALKGRFHSYEGHDMTKVVLPVKVFYRLGVEVVIVTNAAGGLNRGFTIGDVMIISDQIFLPGFAGRHPLVGLNDEKVGPRFPPMSNAYDPSLAHLAWNAGAKVGLQKFMHAEGTYAMVSGPSYEASAESRFLRQVGADAVGMSTCPEVVTARHCGMRVLGFSLITNNVVLVPNTGVPANHEEVMESAKMRAEQMQNLVKEICADLKNEAEIVKSTPAPPKKQVTLMEDLLQAQAKKLEELGDEVRTLKATVAELQKK